VAFSRKCPVCHSVVPLHAKKCRHCHNYLGFSFQWVWEEGIRLFGLLAMIAAAIVAWKSLELAVLAQSQRDEAVAQAQISYQERDAIKEDLSTDALGLGQLQSQLGTASERSLLKAAADSSDLRVRKMLSEALRLKQNHVPFRMGGKSPEEGFDSSGFVAFLLAEAGALDPLYHRTFSVSRLEKTFPSVKAENAKPGDLVFLGKSFVAVHLSANLAVGIGGAKGIQVISISPKASKTYHRWAYEQDSRMLK
jgi:hypothetical protein